MFPGDSFVGHMERIEDDSVDFIDCRQQQTSGQDGLLLLSVPVALCEDGLLVNRIVTHGDRTFIQHDLLPVLQHKRLKLCFIWQARFSSIFHDVVSF